MNIVPVLFLCLPIHLSVCLSVCLSVVHHPCRLVYYVGAPAPQTGRYSNMLQNDLCTETSLPNTESPMVSIPEQRPEVTYPSTVTTTLAGTVL